MSAASKGSTTGWREAGGAGKGAGGLPTVLTLAVFFGSGFAGLVYEVLWMKQLGLLFGNTAHAVAATLASFFLGLAAGGYVWGRRAPRIGRPLRAFALLEFCVAASALLYFLLLDAYHTVYGPLFQAFGSNRALFLGVKFALALGILFPPAFFMGGTLPLMSQHMVRRPERLGRTASGLYAVNTLGAALGAYAAGFQLMPLLGFTNAYLLAVALSVTLAAMAWMLGAEAPASVAGEGAKTAPRPAGTPVLGRKFVLVLSLVSGVVTLGLEVLWTRMFAQVLQNSVYTFAAILVLFLACLGLGGVLSSALARRHLDPARALIALLTGSALLVALTPSVFLWLSGGLGYLGDDAGWPSYVLRVFALVAGVLIVPGVVLGCVFPYLIKVSEPFARGAGPAVGDLVAANTLGAIVGSLAAGFVVLEFLGLWQGIYLTASIYGALALTLTVSLKARSWASPFRLAPVGVLVLVALVLAPARLPLVAVDAETRGERLLATWEGSAATVAVVRTGKQTLKMKVNNYYSLGGTDARKWEEWQAHLPLLLHPAPRSAFFLGMGTGITAGAALSHPVDKVVVTELVPEVVEAARVHFEAYTNGLFADGRATVVAEDGRNYLHGTRDRFDVIVADLFMPWKAGAGSLYTREHFEAARDRLRPAGLYAQWLPLYQMSEREFGIVARTMREVFPLVTLWRGDFFSQGPIVALVGHVTAEPLQPEALAARLEGVPAELRELPLRHFVPDIADLPVRGGRTPDVERFLLYYCGNVSEASDLFAGYPSNSDDRPLIEYGAPISNRRQAAREIPWFVGGPLVRFMERLLAAVPPARDPYLSRLSDRQRAYIAAGLSFHELQVLEISGDHQGAQRAFRRFERTVIDMR